MPLMRSAGTYNATVPRTVGATRNPGHPAIEKLGRQGAGVPPKRKKENPVGEASYASHLITLPVSVGNLETTMIADTGASVNIASQSFISRIGAEVRRTAAMVRNTVLEVQVERRSAAAVHSLRGTSVHVSSPCREMAAAAAGP